MPSLRAPRRALVAALPLLTLAAAVVATLPACYAVADPDAGRRPLALQLPDTGTADGASLTLITATVDSLPASDERTVAFTTTAGVFTASGTASAQVPLDQGRTATVLLRAPADSTTAVVAASAYDAQLTHPIIFRRALPERMDVVPAQFALRAGIANEMEVTARLGRAVGTPSPGVLVTFSASDTGAGARAVGRFSPATAQSDAAGSVTTRFTTADSTVRGPIVIRAVAAPGGVRAEAVIEVLHP